MRRDNPYSAPARSNPRRTQAGFSMIEMLMTAFILAVGVLGLTMLQVMSLKASRGSRSLTTAVQVGESVMDQIEMEGRLSWLNITDTQYAAPTAIAYAGYQHVTVAPSAPPAGGVSQFFNINGDATPSAADPNTYYTATTYRLPNPVGGGATGNMNDFVVRVVFADAVDPNTNTPIQRTVTLTRRILHG